MKVILRACVTALATAMAMALFYPVVGQVGQDDPLTKEIVEVFREPGNEEWLNDKRSSFQYDKKGREILHQISYWSKTDDRWNIKTEEYSLYNKENQRIESRFLDYGEYPQPVFEEFETREYQNGFVKFRRITRRNHQNQQFPTEWVYDVSYDHNENGDRLLLKVLYSVNGEFRGGYGYRRYYDQAYCQTAYAGFDVSESKNEIPQDSIALTSDGHCNYERIAYYNYTANHYNLYLENRSDYDYNSEGRIIRRSDYTRNRSYDEWESTLTFEYTYGSSGLLTALLKIDPLNNQETLQTTEYDGKDRAIHESTQSRSNGENWVTDFDLTRRYNASDQLEQIEWFLDWSETAADFRNYSLFNYSYDVDGNNYRTTIDSRIENTTRVRAIDREFRCDGAIVAVSDHVREVVDNVAFTRESAVHTSYFRQPSCLEVSSVSESVFTLIPNPATDYIKVYNEKQAFGEAHLRILKSSGEVVLEKFGEIANYFSVDLSPFPPGIYLMQIQNGDGRHSQRFIKN